MSTATAQQNNNEEPGLQGTYRPRVFPAPRRSRYFTCS